VEVVKQKKRKRAARAESASSGGGSEGVGRGGRKKGRSGKEKKARRKRSSSSSSSSSSGESSSSVSSTSSSSHSSSSSEEEASSSSSSAGRRKKTVGKRRKKGKSKRVDLDWELLEQLWPVEDRPPALQSQKTVRRQKLTMAEMMGLKDQFEKEQERKGVGAAVFGKDRKPKKRKFKAMTDDGEKRLHPARFVGLPRADPKRYWDQVPAAATEIYRHVPLAHLGVEGVAEQAIVKMHNRRVPVDLDGMFKDCKDCRQVQLAVFNYVAVLRSLHPVDYGGLVILRVLMEAGWGENLGTEKQRVALMKKFFEEAVKDNSGRAVRREVPMDYEQARARWLKVVGGAFPQLSFPYGQVLQTGGGGGGGAGGGSGGGQAGGAGKSQKPAGAGRMTGGNQRTPARYNGLSVCFYYNTRDGCKRPAQGAMTCKDGANVFAHVCNYLMKGAAGQPDRHCLAAHPRFGNH
jgi:hypothetical protein